VLEIAKTIELNHHSGIPLNQQLRNQFIWLIVSGKLNPGDTLPSVRGLAGELAININTVRNAYQLLEIDGLVTTRQGSGTIVLPLDPNRMVDLAQEYHTNTIGVILPCISDPFYHSFLQGVEEVAGTKRTMMLVCDAHEDYTEANQLFNQLISKRVDGIIAVSLPITQYNPENAGGSRLFPFVSVDWPDEINHSVQLDLENAGYLAVQHLIEHGHTRIGMVTVQEDLANTRPLQRGYERALTENGIAFDTDLTVKVPDFKLSDGKAGAAAFLRLSKRPTAIFFISDMLALGAMKFLKASGLRIPEDVAVIGVGDIYLAELVEPELTTVSLPARQLGKEAMNLLKNLMEGTPPAENRIMLPTSLVGRSSCGCRET
jgi:DNA-binding LacI/PurR family transcriptional regulator